MKPSSKKLVVLDAHAIIHRAYHALPTFSNSVGEPTGALYGIVSMLVRIIEEIKPDAIVAAYDLPKPTFRHLAYDGYKKGRAKAEDDLIAQIKSSRSLFEAFEIPCIDAEGFEADDIIGTLVELFKHDPHIDIVIASGDMDTLQLVSRKKVQVFTLKKGITDTVLYDEDAVVARFGFSPNQLVDYKGLRGDPSDNIVGVPGIGEKTATAIIGAFGSIEGLYKAIDAEDLSALSGAGLSSRMIGILREHRDEAFFSKTLATIRKDAPIQYVMPSKTYFSSVSEEKILSCLRLYEFRSLIPRVQKIFSFASPVQTESVDPVLLREAAIGLWILNSELTDPQYEVILEKTKQTTLQDAYRVIKEDLQSKHLTDLFEKIEKPLIPIIDAMQKWGISIDRKYFVSLQEKMKEELLKLEKEIESLVGVSINLNSPKQLSGLLFTTLRLTPKGKKKASGAYTTNAETLESLVEEHPIIPKILEYREIQKLVSTYVEPLLVHADNTDVIHASFLQHGTSTGRFSSVHPNLQNIPIKGSRGAEIRHGFIARPEHVFVGYDYSQIELRILAMLSNDPDLIGVFQSEKDIHTTVASALFGVPLSEVTSDMRRKAKVINFGILYGMGIQALQKNLQSTKAEAAHYYDAYFKAYPNIAKYVEETKHIARSQGYTQTAFGRRRYFPGIHAAIPYLRAFAERMAVNAPIQGTNADIIKIAIACIDEDLRSAGIDDRVHLTLQIHDELVYEVHESVLGRAQAIIHSAMISVFSRSPIPHTLTGTVPLTVSSGVGKRLDELK